MPRDISEDTLTLLANKTGLEPLIIVDVFWKDDEATRYADKFIEGVTGLILSRSSIDDIVKIDFGGNSSSIDLTLDDTDGHLKVLIDKYDIHKRKCIVYQFFGEMDIGEEFEIFRGQVYSPIIWDEGNRQLSFTILSQIESREAGFSPEEGQFYGMPPDLIGKVWPLGFGSPIYVPATRAADVARATTVSFAGLPDHTLIYKKELVEYRIEQIDAAFNYYSVLIAKARELEVAAQQLQLEYANHLVSFTNVRQTLADVSEILENICKQLEVVLKDYEEPDGALDRDEIDDLVESLKETKDEYVDILKELYNAKTHHQRTEDIFKYRTNILKFEINFVAEMRKRCVKLLKDKTKFQRELSVIDEFLVKQSSLSQQNILLQNIYGFTQGVDELLDINGVLFSGSINGRVLTIKDTLATYSGFSLTQTTRQSTAIDTFWLADNYTKIDGMYIYTEHGHIARITRQEGNKYIIDLPSRHRSRNRRRRIDYENDDDIKTLFNNTLSRLLTGSETDGQIAEIASYIPKTINPFIVNKLTGGNRKLKIRLYPDNPNEPLNFNLTDDGAGDINPFFIITYEGTKKSTELLSPSLTPEELKDKLIALAPWLNSSNISVDSSESITQNGITFYYEYVFDVNDNLPHLFTIPWNMAEAEVIDDDPNKTIFTVAVLEYVGSGTKTASLYIDRVKINPAQITISGFYCVYINGRQCFIRALDSAEEVQGAIQIELDLDPGYVTVTGGNLSDVTEENNPEPMVITVNDEYGSIYVDPNYYDEINNSAGLHIEYFESEHNEKYVSILGKPKLVVNYTGVVKKYTKQEISNILLNDLKKTPIGQAVLNAEKVINELLILKQTLVANGQAEEDVDNALNAAYGQLQKMLATNEFKVMKYSVQDLYDNFPKGSFKLLYEQEIYNFLEYINEANNALNEETIDPANLYEFTAINMGKILEASPVILPKWLSKIESEENQFIRLNRIQALPNQTKPFFINIGDTVTKSNSFQQKWIANILPSTVHGVYAKRAVDGLERLVPVPMSFYIKNENDDYGEYSCTSITLARPLKFIDQTWGDDIYVTYTSSIGPNVVNIIEWLVGKYTRLEIDQDSFDHVRDLQANYPANFALFSKQDTLNLISEIAWQARCSIWVNGNKIYIRYLPEEPTSVTTVTESDIEQNTLRLTFTDTEKLITKFEALWRPDYFIQDDYKIVVRRNITAYEEIKDTFNFYIYNMRELVYKSLTFWVIRRASTWRKALFSLFLNKLVIETNDCITIDLQEDFLTTGPIKAIVESSIYDSVSNSIEVECWLPVLANKKEKYKFSWPMDLTTEDIYPELSDVTTGNAGNPIGLGVPNDADYEAFDPTVLDQRPDDFGTDKVYDTEDTLPVSLVSGISEIEYEIKSSQELLLDPDEDLGEANAFNTPVPSFDPTEAEEDEVGKVFSARVIAFVGGTIDGEDIVDGNTEINVSRKQYEFLLNDGKVVVAEPFDLGADIADAAELNGRFMLIRQEDSSYKFYLPDYGRSITGGNV